MTKMKEATSASKKRGIDQVIEKDGTTKQDEVVVKEEKVDADVSSASAVAEKVDIDSEVCNTEYIYVNVYITDDTKTVSSRSLLFWYICIYCPIY